MPGCQADFFMQKVLSDRPASMNCADGRHLNLLALSWKRPVSCTWTPGVCKIMASWTMFAVLGHYVAYCCGLGSLIFSGVEHQLPKHGLPILLDGPWR